MVRGHIYYDLVKSERRSGRIIHRRIMYLGKLSELGLDQRILLVERIDQLLSHQYRFACGDAQVEELAVFYTGKYYSRRGHSQSEEALGIKGGALSLGPGESERIDLGSFTTVRVRSGGAEWLCCQALEHLGLRSFLLEELQMDARLVDLGLLNLMGRLLYPVSERKTALWLQEDSSAVELGDFSPDSVHGASLIQGALALFSHYQVIEDHLYERLARELGFDENEVLLYDLTNTYFEGRMQGSSLAQYGRSKERRNDCPLVSMGLLTNVLGFVRRSDYYAGNVNEAATLEQVMEQIKASGGLLTDAGVGVKDNIEKMALEQIPYMCVVRQGFADFEVDFEQADCFDHQTSNGQQYKVWLAARRHTFEVEGQSFADWLIFVKSQAKQAKEDGIVALQKQRFENGLNQIRQSLSKPRGHKKVEQVHQRIGRLRARYSRVSKAFDVQTTDDGIIVEDLRWSYDARHEKRNGSYIIRTSMPIQSPQQAWQAYHKLSTIEAVNRCLKTDLNLRPVFHQKDRTIKAHLFLSLLACTIVHYIRYRLAAQNIHESWSEIVRIMNSQKTTFSQFSNDQDELFLLAKWTQPEAKAKQIYDAMGYLYQPYNGFFFKIVKPDP